MSIGYYVCAPRLWEGAYKVVIALVDEWWVSYCFIKVGVAGADILSLSVIVPRSKIAGQLLSRWVQ